MHQASSMLWPTNCNLSPNFWNAVSCRQGFFQLQQEYQKGKFWVDIFKSQRHINQVSTTPVILSVRQLVTNPGNMFALGPLKTIFIKMIEFLYFPLKNIFLSKCYILILVSISLQMWVYSDRVLEWFYWLLNRVRTFQYRKSWRKNLPIFPFHLNLNQISFHSTFMISYF